MSGSGGSLGAPGERSPHSKRAGANAARFAEVWARCLTPGSTNHSRELFAELWAMYIQEGRYYHTPAHVEHCLSRLDLCRAHLRQPDEVELAIWYHDAVYDPHGADNEERSAELFRSHAEGVMDEARIERINRLVLATTHRESPQCEDQKLMVDIDLSGFGLPWEEFVRDSRAVRAEFAHLSDADFYDGQIRFLHYLMDRDRFFISDFFHERYERQARENVARTLATLEEAGFG